MKVLTITGDRSFKPGHPRYDLQASAVDELRAVYWGKGDYWPRIPQESFDVVSAQDPFWRGLFGWYVAKKLKARFNVQVHTDLSVYRGIRQVLAQLVLRRAHSVRVVSEKIKKQVEYMGVKGKVIVLPVFIDPEPFLALRSQPHDQKTVLWIGRIEDEKDPLLAVRVFEAVHAKLDAKLVMLGTGSLEKSVKAAASHLPVVFPGWQLPASYLSQADAVLSTSKHESYGASIIEALIAGVPVVALDVGVAKEAGAIVLPQERLAEGLVDVLQTGARGELKVKLLDKNAWTRAWREIL